MVLLFFFQPNYLYNISKYGIIKEKTIGEVHMGDNANDKSRSTEKHSNDKDTVIIGESNSKKQVFNVQSSGTKPYDTSNVLKQSGSNNKNK